MNIIWRLLCARSSQPEPWSGAKHRPQLRTMGGVAGLVGWGSLQAIWGPLLLVPGHHPLLEPEFHCAPGCHLVRRPSPRHLSPRSEKDGQVGKCCCLFRNGQGGPVGDGQTLGSPAWRPWGHSCLSTLCKLKFTDICWLCLILAGAGPGQGRARSWPHGPFLVHWRFRPHHPQPS